MNPKVNHATQYLKSVRDVAQLLLAGDRFDFKAMNPAVESKSNLEGVFSYLPKIAQSKAAASELLGKSSPDFMKSSESLVKMLNALKNNWPAAPSDVRDAAVSVQTSSKSAWGTVLAEKAKELKQNDASRGSENAFSNDDDHTHAPQPK